LRTVAAMRGLCWAFDQAAFAQEAALDGVGGDENVGGFGMEMVFGSPQEAEAFFGDFEIAGAPIIGGSAVAVVVVLGRCAHICHLRVLGVRPPILAKLAASVLRLLSLLALPLMASMSPASEPA